MRVSKTEIIIGCGTLAAILIVACGGLWWHHHENHAKQLSAASSQTTGNPDTSLSQSDSGGLGVSGQASELGQLGSSGNNQSQGGQNSSGSSGSSGDINPASFAQYSKYESSKDALFGDIQKGSGTQLTAGHKAGIYYKVWLTNGALVDQSPVSSGGQPQPFSFTPGAHQVIPGLEEGVYAMKTGGKRLVIVPPAVGYGTKGQGAIPPNSVLVFEVQLVSVN